MITWPTKDPQEVLDYQLNWADQVNGPRLVTGELLTASTFILEQGTVVIQTQSFIAAGITTVWLTGGTTGEVCQLTNRVVTNQGRTYDKACRLRIRDKI